MAKGTTFTATMPDGFVAKRTSQSMTYTHVVICGPDDANWERYAAALERTARNTDKMISEDEAWHKSQENAGRDLEWKEDRAAHIARRRADVQAMRERAAQCREQRKMVGADGWGVLRWSQSEDNAIKAMRSREMQWHADYGYVLRVIAVNA